MARKPIHRFEDELGELVDRYLLDGDLTLDEIKGVLKSEANYDHVERLGELLKKDASK